MNKDKYVFAQLVGFLDNFKFLRIVREYDGDKYVKSYTCWNQLLTMMFGQLSNREGLRDLIVALEAHAGKVYHLGIKYMIANRIADNILHTIGQTPMVRINRLVTNNSVNIYAKLKGFNPTGSIKDRIAVQMIEDAERSGALKKGQTIIEPTSGNTGIGLAVIGVVKGYDVVIVMSDAVSVERRKIIRSYGAEVILTPGAEGTDGAIRLARKMVSDNPGKYFMPDQFANAANYQAHYERTALEIWEQTEGKIDYIVCALGTSGTIMGISRFMRALKPDIKVVCVHPVRGHYIQGLKNMEEALVPAIYDPSRIDFQIMVASEEAIEMARRLIRREGLFVGMSSGAAMLAASRIAGQIKSGNIVVVFPDRAEKYLSTSMFNL